MKRIAIILTVLCGWMVSCDSVDCSLNNTVFCHLAFYNGEGEKVALQDTLSIMIHGTETVLYNRGVRKSEVSIPMSYHNPEDTLLLRVWGQDYSLEAEIAVGKSNTEYFESPDCPVKMFHNITSAYVFSGRFIDSVSITKPSVNFQTDENIRVYLH